MQYSPKLKKAMEEIKAIVEKHDIAAVVVLTEPGHSEYLQKVNPSFSCARFEAGSLRITAKASEIGKQKRDELLTNTSNMFKLLADNTARIASTMIQCSTFIDTHTGADHTRGGHTSHDQQNN